MINVPKGTRKILDACDFFSVEVWRLHGLTTCCVLLVIELPPRPPNPHAYAERLVGSIEPACSERLTVLGEALSAAHSVRGDTFASFRSEPPGVPRQSVRHALKWPRADNLAIPLRTIRVRPTAAARKTLGNA